MGFGAVSERKQRQEYVRTQPQVASEGYVVVGNSTPGTPNKKVSVATTVESVAKKGESAPKATAGFLLTDSSLRPVLFNAEAIEILSYPDKLAKLTHSDVLLAAKIRSTLVSQQTSGEWPFVAEFRSGRRRYFCRTFFVDSHAKNPSSACVAALLERVPSGLAPLSQASRQFNLTQREREALEYLLQGLTIKVIANRMDISPNTVKAFLRMIMIKTGVSSRSAMVSKIIFGKAQ
jgi:DNA-binding CsgD family transcriptional regulator